MSGVDDVVTGASKGSASALLSDDVLKFLELDTSLLEKLEIHLNRVEALLTDAEEKLFEGNPRVENSAQKARFAIYDAKDLRDPVLADVPGSNKVRTSTIDLVESSDYSVKDRAIHPCKEAIKEELVKIIKSLLLLSAQKDVLGLKEKRQLASYRLLSSLANKTSTIYGRSEDKKIMMRLLNSREGHDDALRVIPIVGMGGIGKTTLACLVFYEYPGLNQSFVLPNWLEGLVQRRPNPHVFDVKGWACVSDVFDAAHVIKSLLESITGHESKADNSLELLQQELKEKLQDKTFLVVLDDVWTDDPQNWEVLRTSFSVGAPGSRVIVTTRSENVARIVTTSHDLSFYELDPLSWDESWFLFEEIVLRDANSSKCPLLKDIGIHLVIRCKGLPLVIKMIAGLLCSKENDETGWRSVFNNKIWERANIIMRFPEHKSLSGVLPNLRRLRVEDCPLVDQNSWS